MFGIDFGGWLNDIANWILQPIQEAWSWFVSQAWAFINWLWNLIPAPTAWPGPNVASALSIVLSDVQGPLAAINYYSPINLMFVLILIVLAEEGLLATWHAIRWILTHLPFVGGDV